MREARPVLGGEGSEQGYFNARSVVLYTGCLAQGSNFGFRLQCHAIPIAHRNVLLFANAPAPVQATCTPSSAPACCPWRATQPPTCSSRAQVSDTCGHAARNAPYPAAPPHSTTQPWHAFHHVVGRAGRCGTRVRKAVRSTTPTVCNRSLH